MEGRFLQVSGIRFAFDPSQPPGSRIVPGSVFVGSEALDKEKMYTIAAREYIQTGHVRFLIIAVLVHALYVCHCPMSLMHSMLCSMSNRMALTRWQSVRSLSTQSVAPACQHCLSTIST